MTWVQWIRDGAFFFFGAAFEAYQVSESPRYIITFVGTGLVLGLIYATLKTMESF